MLNALVSLNLFDAGNSVGGTYVAYLFASNAGGFGNAGTDNVITCGSYTGAAVPNAVTLGYEPQWVMVKRTDTAGYDWVMLDVMRGDSLTGQAFLAANLSDAEATYTNYFYPTATGFAFAGTNAEVNAAGGTYVYVAIRRGPMKVPTTGTSVFSPTNLVGDNTTGRAVSVGFAPDLTVFHRQTGDPVAWTDKLRGTSRQLKSDSTAAEIDQSAGTPALASFSNTGLVINNGPTNVNTNALNNYAYLTFKRAPGFFDEVCYTGTGSTTSRNHNLGVSPEIIILKKRGTDDATVGTNWGAYVSALGSGNLFLNATNAYSASSYLNMSVTSTTFTDTINNWNVNSETYVAYLFATLAGVSKVGSYTGTGATQTISCGFTGGARFVLVKRTDTTGDWYVWDTARGMVSGTDPYFFLNSTASDVNANSIYTATGGFQIVSTAAGINASGGTYIFLAIA